MNKDVIYIDVEDDITAIIGKVKASKERIVALVPPKRIGALQSAVNLRLIDRAAKSSDKRLVVITSNQALIALTAAAQIPVARNLQSKPEIAEIAALDIDDGEDVIDGAQLPVGEHARSADKVVASSPKKIAVTKAVDDIAATETPQPGRPTAKKPPVKVPDFNKFRKKLFLIIGGVVALIVFFVWAIWFAPQATVVITAKTSGMSIDQNPTLSTTAATSLEQATLRSIVQTQEKELSAEFTPTGQKEVGANATGTMRLTRTNPSSTPLTVPAGTTFTSGNYRFASTEAATLVTSLTPGGVDAGSATVSVRAEAIGDEYNLSSRGYDSSVSGVSARGSAMSGGSKRTITVVSQEDVTKAVESLANADEASIKAALQSAFDDGDVVIAESYTVKKADPAATPGVDQEASGPAKVVIKVTYTLTGVAKAEVAKYLDAYTKKELEDNKDQRVYKNGADDVFFANFTPTEQGATVKMTTTAQVGPNINDDQIKEQVKGKRYGEIQSELESIEGVDNVDVKFWPFWVSAVPGDTKKITIEFKLD